MIKRILLIIISSFIFVLNVNAETITCNGDFSASINIDSTSINVDETVNISIVESSITSGIDYLVNYKNSNETVTVILAQDLLEAQPKELDLVTNINATGENNDYMSIKNDKLMFVLMKAIQEQQEQIEQLKSEIDNIKKSY